ncbi:ATP-binding protein [Actinoplanes sp. NPDC051851]|uniref:sensor histidine kinase n=1 Tax=Actinoplanes sp. NPDC051851 TaxID=3154753 RepID=UPI003418EE62
MSALGRLTRRIAQSSRPRRTVRLRLTLLYGTLFLVSGAALLAVVYVLVHHAVSGAADNTFSATGGDLEMSTGQPGPIIAPSPGQLGTSTMDVLRVRTEQAIEAQKDAVMHSLLVNSGIALAVMSLASIALGWLVAGRILRPVRTITAAAREISATSLHRRLALEGPDDELKELGDTFDGLLTRLEASFEAQRRFVANASHELRTPLARQRALGEVALADPDATMESLRAAHERILVAGGQQERLIEALLTLTRSHGGIAVREPFDLAQLTHEVVDSRRPDAQDRGVTIHGAIGPALATGHRNLAERLVGNLVDNGLRHNVRGGRVEVTTAMVAGRPALTVVNTGPVVPESEVERLFQPFQRLETNRRARAEGLGLGLSIVHAIVVAHDATIETVPRPEGGLAVTVTFPAPATESQVSTTREQPVAQRA